jgi:hypothetical protein
MKGTGSSHPPAAGSLTAIELPADDVFSASRGCESSREMPA